MCNTCGRKLPLRGLQYTAAPSAPPNRPTLAQRLAVVLAWLAMLVVLAAVGFWLWQNVGVG
jgi:hypothetical protein